MKKLIAYLVILCITLTGIVGTHLSLTHSGATLLDGKGEDCPITETVLAGDPACLEGWQVNFTLYAGDHLQWDGTYHLGAEGSCETSEHFSLAPVQRYELEFATFQLDCKLSATYDDAVNTFSTYGYGPLLKYAKEHASSTSDTVTVPLGDIIDDFPFLLYAHCDLGDLGYYVTDILTNNSGILYHAIEPNDNYLDWRELFRFPVQPEDTAAVTMDFGSSEVDFTLNIETGSYVQCYQRFTDTGLYLLPVYRSTDGAFLKTAHAQGVGIYFLPYQDYGSVSVDNERRSAITADARNAVNVCPLDEDAQVCFAQFSEAADTVTLVLLEEDQYIVQVMELSGGTVLQRMPVTTSIVPSGEAVIHLTGSTLSLRQGDTITAVDLSGQEEPLTIDATGLSIMTSNAIDLSSGGLVLKDGQAVFVRPCSGSLFEVMAWDSTGLLFHGKYTYAALDEPQDSPEPSLEILPTSVKPSRS